MSSFKKIKKASKYADCKNSGKGSLLKYYGVKTERRARAMVTQYGMSEKVGMIQYGGDEEEVFIGRDFGHTKNYADQTAALIDSEVKRIIDEAYERAKEILSQNEEVLHKCAALLIEKEKIGREEFEALF